MLTKPTNIKVKKLECIEIFAREGITMNLTNWKSEYLTVLKLHVPDITGFDEAFSDISSNYLQALVSLIINPEMNKGLFIKSYDEVADFLDGNGFKVEGNEKYGYTITLLKT